MAIKIALAGNPNCGKTTMFNDLTGLNQFVGNWPGVTVEKKEGRLKGADDVIIQDLPGIYSLSPYTLEEVVARGYLVNHHDRTIAEPALPVEQAQESLSDALTVDSVRPALIPTSGQNEVVTYEFLCSSATGDRILAYINSQTGAEEQLLILLQTPNGTLTK